MRQIKTQLLIIGGGPGGYVCGIRAGQLGLDTVLIEAEKPGGTCLNVGCVPSKALIHAADEFHRLNRATAPNPLGLSTQNPTIDLTATQAWKDAIVGRLTGGVAGLLKKAGVRLIEGHATLTDGKTAQVTVDGETLQIEAEHLVIATGSAPVELPFLPFNDTTLSSTGALSLTDLPQNLAVVGGGYIGVEIATAYAKLGSNVTIVEAESHILAQYDPSLTRPVEKSLAALGVTLLTNTRALGASNKTLEIETNNGTQNSVPADKILVAVGRAPRSRAAGIAELGLTMNGPFLAIDAQCQTSMRATYAIGDVTGEPMLAHRAMAQGTLVAEHISGLKRSWDVLAIPAVCFSDPEIVTCGLSQAQAKSQGIKTTTGQFPLSANARALTMEGEAGFIRTIARASDHVIIGLEGVGTGISELSAAFSIALEMGARLEDIAQIIHAHPTQSEGLQEAAHAALGHALHI